MSSTNPAAPGAPAGKQVPRDAVVMHALLKELGVSQYDSKIPNQMLDFVYRYVTQIVEEAKIYSTYAKKKVVDVEDIKLAVKISNQKNGSSVPPREMLMDIVKTKNMTPLPLIKSNSGLKLPPDRFCLTQPNYRLQFYKKAPTSYSSNTPSPNVRLSGAGISGSGFVFKVPSLQPPN